MNGINRVTLMGHLGKDAETKFTTSGVAKTDLTVATKNSYKDGDTWKTETFWHRVVAWRKEGLAPYLTKGKQVVIEGSLRTRQYDKDGQKMFITEVVASDIYLCDGAKGDQTSAPAAKASKPATSEAVTDDDVPF